MTASNIVLVTGAASGMGRLAARRYAQQGRMVIGADINEPGLAETVEGFPQIYPYKVDITQFSDVEKLVADIEKEKGAITQVIHCAAIMPLQLLGEQSVDEIHRVMDINYKGTVNINKAILPYFLQRNSGKIVNFASIAGWVPCMYFGAYDASKFAVVAFTEVLHHEHKNTGIQFCCVCPPPVATPMLNNVNYRPQILDHMETVQPEQVLDAMEKSLRKGQLFCYPGKRTWISILMRRLFPALPWIFNHLAEKPQAQAQQN